MERRKEERRGTKNKEGGRKLKIGNGKKPVIWREIGELHKEREEVFVKFRHVIYGHYHLKHNLCVFNSFVR